MFPLKLKQIVAIVSVAILLAACSNKKNADTQQIFIIDSTIEKDIRKGVKEEGLEWLKPGAVNYDFNSATHFTYYENDTVQESSYFISKTHSAYYYFLHDTLNIWVHHNNWATRALHAEVFNGKLEKLRYVQAHHENVDIYRLQPSDTSTQGVEVPCKDYKLKISIVPDSLHKQIIYGEFSLKSNDFYQKLDDQEGPAEWNVLSKLNVDMAFSFQAKYRSFDDW